MENLYLYINLAVILGPLALSFDKHLKFYKSWTAFLKAWLWVALPFLIWDVLFTANGIWGFNERYLSGISLLGLPLGEILFFASIPYSCIFLYRTFEHHFPKFKLAIKGIKWFAALLILFGALLILVGWMRWYSMTVGIILCAMAVYYSQQKDAFHARFAIIFILTLIPFLVVNGLLTGSWIEEEIVWYNNMQNSTLRIGTIPVEDLAYAFTLLYPFTRLYYYYHQEKA